MAGERKPAGVEEWQRVCTERMKVGMNGPECKWGRENGQFEATAPEQRRLSGCVGIEGRGRKTRVHGEGFSV